mgnify:CR=1 FL=1
MKVVAFNGSPRKDGNTFQSLKVVCDELEQAGIDTESIRSAGRLPPELCKMICVWSLIPSGTRKNNVFKIGLSGEK